MLLLFTKYFCISFFVAEFIEEVFMRQEKFRGRDFYENPEASVEKIEDWIKAKASMTKTSLKRQQKNLKKKKEKMQGDHEENQHDEVLDNQSDVSESTSIRRPKRKRSNICIIDSNTSSSESDSEGKLSKLYYRNNVLSKKC